MTDCSSPFIAAALEFPQASREARDLIKIWSGGALSDAYADAALLVEKYRDAVLTGNATPFIYRSDLYTRTNSAAVAAVLDLWGDRDPRTALDDALFVSEVFGYASGILAPRDRGVTAYQAFLTTFAGSEQFAGYAQFAGYEQFDGFQQFLKSFPDDGAIEAGSRAVAHRRALMWSLGAVMVAEVAGPLLPHKLASLHSLAVVAAVLFAFAWVLWDIGWDILEKR